MDIIGYYGILFIIIVNTMIMKHLKKTLWYVREYFCLPTFRFSNSIYGSTYETNLVLAYSQKLPAGLKVDEYRFNK